MFLTLSLAAAIGVLSFKGYTPYHSFAESAPVAQVARAASTQTYYKVELPEKRKAVLSAYVETQKGVKKATTVSGRIEAYYFEPRDLRGLVEGDTTLRFALVSGKDVYELRNLQDRLSPAIDGTDVTLTGFVASSRGGKKEMLVDITSAESHSLARARKIEESSSRDEGNRDLNCVSNLCVLVIPVDMSGNTAGLPTPAEIEEYIFNGRIRDALLEESYGQLSIDGFVAPWLSSPAETLSPFYATATIEQYLLAQNINIGDYEQLVFLINGGSQSNSGESSIGSALYSANGQSYNLPVALVGFSSYTNNGNLTTSNGHLSYFDYLYTHETGHSLNALHDNFLNCQNGPMSLPSQCISIEYGNKYSIMGDGSYGGHFSFLQKLRAGWINMPPLSSAGTYSLEPLEISGATTLGIDGNQNYIPEFAMERRTDTGLDSQALFTGLNMSGEFLYRLLDPVSPDTMSDPMTWRMELIDTTPASSSATWFNSVNDVVFKQPQRYPDRQSVVQFAQSLNGNNNTIVVSPGFPVANPCTRNPIRAFEPYVNQGDRFTGQLASHRWPLKTGQQSIASNLIQDIQADTSDPSAQVLLYKNFMLFNDDFLACGDVAYSFELLYNGTPLSLVSDAGMTYRPWSGPHYQTIMAFMPVYGLQYGHHTITLKVTKQNDGSIFSRSLIFNLVP